MLQAAGAVSSGPAAQDAWLLRLIVDIGKPEVDIQSLAIAAGLSSEG
jgi:hypothetical protein